MKTEPFRIEVKILARKEGEEPREYGFVIASADTARAHLQADGLFSNVLRTALNELET